jgi:uncharacterized protein (DUF488 family)
MPTFDLFSIGHSNIPAERFLGLLHDAGVNIVADVRSAPFSRFFSWFSQKPLAARLKATGIAYTFMGDTLGAVRATNAFIATVLPTTTRWRCSRNFATACSA